MLPLQISFITVLFPVIVYKCPPMYYLGLGKDLIDTVNSNLLFLNLFKIEQDVGVSQRTLIFP